MIQNKLHFGQHWRRTTLATAVPNLLVKCDMRKRCGYNEKKLEMDFEGVMDTETKCNKTYIH